MTKRNALTHGEVQLLSRALCERFFMSMDLSFVKVIHCYLPIAEKNEPDTWLILDRLKREFGHIRIVLPRINGEEIENIFFEGLHQLVKNEWNILEPRQGVPAAPEKMDVVLVPLVAVDTTGHRVGYGKGFYDRFLKTCKPDCQKIGLSFFEPQEKLDDPSAYDVRLDLCITPDRVYAF